MVEIASADLVELAGMIGPDPDEVIEEMEARKRREGFPTVGREVGIWLSVFARLSGAERVFEFGSGFGYSAYWFARALGSDGEVVLTEVDGDELEDARDYFERGGIADRAAFERGDAIEIVERYDGPFDIVLVDNEKERYVEAFEAVRGKLRPGSLVLADNAVTAGPIDRDALLELLRGTEVETNAATRGIAAYHEHVRTLSEFETALLPMGEGVAVSVKL